MCNLFVFDHLQANYHKRTEGGNIPNTVKEGGGFSSEGEWLNRILFQLVIFQRSLSMETDTVLNWLSMKLGGMEGHTNIQ